MFITNVRSQIPRSVIITNAFTASRISCYIKSSSRPNSSDARLILFRNEVGKAEFALETKKSLKAHDPESSRLDFKGVEGFLELFDIRADEPAALRVIEWNPKVLDQPIFADVDGSILTASKVSTAMRELGFRSGFPQPFTIHDLRAESLTTVDMASYSDTQRQRLAGHRNNAIHQQHYAALNPGVDSQAAFQGKPARPLSIASLFRQLEVPWVAALWQTLPLKKEEELLGEYDSTPCAESCTESPTGDTVFHPEKKAHNDRKSFLKKGLQDYWKETATRTVIGSEEYSCKGVNHPFSRLRSILPVRGPLADLMAIPARLRSEDGKTTFKLLTELYKSTTEVGRKALSACACGKVAQASNRATYLHVYQCRKKKDPSAEYCCSCNEWFSGTSAWDDHCAKHLREDSMPVELAWERIEQTFIPGYCIFCLWDQKRSASQRLFQFMEDKDWKKEITNHWRSAPKGCCPDPRCTDNF
ncbi:uncharacterized protein B0I36DRAFT_288833, partial [Microdochium trichocladiopsis]